MIQLRLNKIGWLLHHAGHSGHRGHGLVTIHASHGVMVHARHCARLLGHCKDARHQKAGNNSKCATETKADQVSLLLKVSERRHFSAHTGVRSKQDVAPDRSRDQIRSAMSGSRCGGMNLSSATPTAVDARSGGAKYDTEGSETSCCRSVAEAGTEGWWCTVQHEFDTAALEGA